MAVWRVELSDLAEDDLAALDKLTRHRVIDALDWLSENFENITPIPLGGIWKGFFKLRVGDWRVIYELKHEWRVLVIHYIDHRNKIYKRRR
ncbi:MAG: type II toxin-antitoxin system RelE/ParE family toxin [Patescibacteria group bacterium]